MGGMLSAIGRGYVQKEIQQSAYEYQKSIENHERVIVGVNEFVSEKAGSIPVHRIDPLIEKNQIASLERVKNERDARLVGQSLDQIGQVAATKQNLLPAIVKAVEAYASLGEISDRLRTVFGEYEEGPTA